MFHHSILIRNICDELGTQFRNISAGSWRIHQHYDPDFDYM